MNNDDKQIIEHFITNDEPEKAINKCMEILGSLNSHSDDYELWFILGKAFWRNGQRKEATVAYRRSADLNPDGPAITALEICENIASFFNPDLLNP